MKTLSILRHAKSSWDQPDLPDFYRPLNYRGQQTAPLMGRWLKQSNNLPEWMITSPAIRAWTTAHMVAETLYGYHQTIHCDPRLYGATLHILLTVLAEVDDAIQHLMLVGHNPGLTELANRLGTEAVDNLPTCAICRIDLPIEQWADIVTSRGITRALDRPRDVAKQLKRSEAADDC